MAGCLRIELITIGDELLLGLTIDTNAAYLSRELAVAGIEIVRRSTVGDTPSAIAAAVDEALARSGAVITTGGLGPTSDDLTKPAIAALFGRAMSFDASIYERIERRWRDRGLPGSPPAVNRQQALVPDGVPRRQRQTPVAHGDVQVATGDRQRPNQRSARSSRSGLRWNQRPRRVTKRRPP